MNGISLRIQRLTGIPAELSELQFVMESAPGYTRRITGHGAGPEEAQTTLSALPPGKGLGDKFVFGIYEGGLMVGCLDLIRGYPEAATAFLGLLMLAEKAQGRGLGAAAYALAEREVLAWGSCRKIRLGVVRANGDVLPFWRKQGFRETGEVKPYHCGSVESETILLEKVL